MKMDDCIFCKIIANEIDSKRFYEDDNMIIIKDVAPRAKLHYLAILKKHAPLIENLDEADGEVLGKCLLKIAELASSLGLEKGFRLQVNQKAYCGQSVPHLHIHILGGEPLGE